VFIDLLLKPCFVKHYAYVMATQCNRASSVFSAAATNPKSKHVLDIFREFNLTVRQIIPH
jgi:hypothetical protein